MFLLDIEDMPQRFDPRIHQFYILQYQVVTHFTLVIFSISCLFIMIEVEFSLIENRDTQISRAFVEYINGSSRKIIPQLGQELSPSGQPTLWVYYSTPLVAMQEDFLVNLYYCMFSRFQVSRKKLYLCHQYCLNTVISHTNLCTLYHIYSTTMLYSCLAYEQN